MDRLIWESGCGWSVAGADQLAVSWATAPASGSFWFIFSFFFLCANFKDSSEKKKNATTELSCNEKLSTSVLNTEGFNLWGAWTCSVHEGNLLIRSSGGIWNPTNRQTFPPLVDKNLISRSSCVEAALRPAPLSSLCCAQIVLQGRRKLNWVQRCFMRIIQQEVLWQK